MNLRRALERDPLRLHYPLQWSLTSGQILRIDEWVLRTAVTQAKGWLDDGLPPMTMSVNLSAVQTVAQAQLPA